MMLLKPNIAALARQAGLNYRTVYAYVNGERRPKYESAAKLKRASGIDELIWLRGDSAEIKKALAAHRPDSVSE